METSIRAIEVTYMVTEFGRSGIMRYPMSIVPAKLPSVLTAVSRPTLPPTPAREDVITRTRKGHVIANNASGTQKRIAEASKEPTATLKSRHQYANGSRINTVIARESAA